MIKQTPIIFTDIMAQKLFDGRKTTTLRVRGLKDVNQYPVKRYWGTVCDYGLMRRLTDSGELRKRSYLHWLLFPEQWHHFFIANEGEKGKEVVVRCPYGAKGDLLWVREPFVHDGPGCDNPDCGLNHHVYRGAATNYYIKNTVWKPSIFMPKYVSRMVLKLKEATVLPVSLLNESHTVNEGLTVDVVRRMTGRQPETTEAQALFRVALNHLHGDGFYEGDPLMWYLRFEVLKKNIGDIIE